MSTNTLVRGAVITGLVGCALVAGTSVAFAAATGGDTTCVNGGSTYPECTPVPTPTPSAGMSEGGGPGVTTSTAPVPATTTVIAGGAGTTETSTAATSLPFTGFEAGAAAAVGIAALGAGTILIVGSRRRRHGDSAAL